MYYQSYEEYIRNILGYPTYEANNQYSNTYNNIYTINNRPQYNQELLNLYPEIHRVLNPMVCKICETNTKPISKELIEQMTDEIYANFEADDTNLGINTTNVRVNIKEPVNENINSARINKTGKQNRVTNVNNTSHPRNSTDNDNREKQQDRYPKRNMLLRDFIKTLILNELLFNNRSGRYNINNQYSSVNPQMLRENRYYNNYMNY